MNITLPPKTNSREQIIIDSKSIIVVGANGAGKTRFGSAIESQHNAITHRIAAQKSLSMPEQVKPTSTEKAQSDFLYGHETGNVGNKMIRRWGQKPNTYLLNDYEKLMVLLHTEEYEESVKFKDSYTPGQANNKPVTKLDRIQSIWEEVLPHRKITKRAGRIDTFPIASPDKSYNASEMSDGERVIFYLIGEVISVSPNSILVIDEPEMHLHKSITKLLWDRIEQERPDCSFIYLTHDIDFASSRSNSTKIWIKNYDGNSWDYEILKDDINVPEQLYLEILGSRKSVLFIEGDESSFDYKLFQLIFPEFMVKPLGSCTKVIEATRSFNEQKSFHHIQSYGFIDRDRRTSDEISLLNQNNIWVAEVAEVENYFLLEEVVKTVAVAMHKNPEAIFGEVKSNVVSFFKSQLESQIVQHVAWKIEAALKNAVSLNDVKEFKDLETSLNSFWGKQNFKETYDVTRSVFEHMIKDDEYEGVLKVFNNKGLLSNSRVAILNDLNSKNSAYINFILSVLKEKSANSERIRQAMIKKVCKTVT